MSTSPTKNPSCHLLNPTLNHHNHWPVFFPVCVCVCVCVHTLSRAIMSNSLQPQGLQPTRLPCPCSFSGKNIWASCHFLLQGIFPTQGSNLHLLHPLYWQADFLALCRLGSPHTTHDLSQQSNMIHRKKPFTLQSSLSKGDEMCDFSFCSPFP